ncbi:MAG: 2-C-methyl-D-erythritol 4-phosphate cytidylyltransferase [Burkholderia sp.]|nr:2-C-methyl-D-erythritol 4-phosphate cytidylyltransferase [Burkholderia sp.]
MTQRFFSLIPCAGIGSRSISPIPKQYMMLLGRTLLYHTLSAFSACSEFLQILVVLAPDDIYFDYRNFEGMNFIIQRCGGQSRQDSVMNGLLALEEFGATGHDWVLVHDAVRPGITSTLIQTLIKTLKDDPVGGIVALPVVDALKRVAAGGKVVERSEPRDRLWQAQTPQMFRIEMLRNAILFAQQQGYKLDDEASAIELAGYMPRIVYGSFRNFKVTYPEDFDLAEAILLRDIS